MPHIFFDDNGVEMKPTVPKSATHLFFDDKGRVKPEGGLARSTIYHRSWLARKLAAAAAGVPFVPQTRGSKRKAVVSEAALRSRDYRARVKAAKEAGVEFVPKPRGGKAVSVPKKRDYAARKKAAKEAGVPFVPQKRGRKPGKA